MIYFMYFNEGVSIVSAKFNDLVINSPKTKQKLIELWIEVKTNFEIVMYYSVCESVVCKLFIIA